MFRTCARSGANSLRTPGELDDAVPSIVLCQGLALEGKLQRRRTQPIEPWER